MRKRAERAVRASEERLRQAQRMESIGLLAGGVAHDFNNLLACIMGNASLLREEVFEEKQEKAEAIIRASEKAADLTRQLLAYAGKGHFVVSTHNFSEVVLDMTGLLRASIPKKVNLNLALAPDLPGVEADRGQLQQIVMNLVLNGVEAIGADRSGSLTVGTGVRELSEADGLSDEITAGGLAPGSYVWLEVADTGEGMDEETRKKVFEPFFTTKFLGRGLGLAAVSGIVRRHEGGIRVTSAPGKGSCFTVLFPAVERVAAGASITETDRATEGSGTILVVDDEDLVRAMVKRTLERYGYVVLEADSGVCAVEVLEGHTGDIAAVVLDLSMPGLSGEETLPELRRLRPSVKVLLSSGYAEDEAMRLFQGQQISGFIQKPYTASALAEKISRVIGPGPARPV
jgi:nitrogen-specific signal transduction histidine kinase/CheY-like chemotaxis protein